LQHAQNKRLHPHIAVKSEMKNNRKIIAAPEPFIWAAIGITKKTIAKKQLDAVHSLVNLEVSPHLLTSWKTGIFASVELGGSARVESKADMFIVMSSDDTSTF